MYLLLKHMHISCVILSGLGFTLRGVLMLVDSPLRQHPFARMAPHFIDTLLLASALALTVQIGQYPFSSDWLTAKLCGLIAYIILGAIALKYGGSRRLRGLCFVLALFIFGAIITIARNHSVSGLATAF